MPQNLKNYNSIMNLWSSTVDQNYCCLLQGKTTVDGLSADCIALVLVL